MAWPVGPLNNAITTINGTAYIYNSTTNAWSISTPTYSSVSNILTVGNSIVTGNLTANTVVNSPAMANGNSNVTIAANSTVAIAANGAVRVTVDANGNVGVGNTAPVHKLSVTGNVNVSGDIIPSSSFMRNRIINGAMQIAQRTTSATVTAGTAVPTASTGYPCVDRWFVYSTGANVTAAQVAGAGSNKNLLQVTGAASVTAIGIGQRIEQLNSYDLAGQTCVLSVNIANSLLTTVTWTASYANTADTFGTIGTATKTQIATGTFTVTSALTQYTTTISVPGAATTGIEILFTVGAQTSGTFQIGNVQLEPGSNATPFERRMYGQELVLCQRYYYAGTNAAYGYPSPNSGGYAYVQRYDFKVTMRATPTVATTYTSHTNVSAVNTSTRTVDFFMDQIVSTITTNTTWVVSYTASAEL